VTLVCPNESEANLLNIICNKASSGAGSDLRLHLYEVPTSAPDETTTLVSLTEATGSGYDGPKDMPNADWTVATVAGVTTAEHAEITFTYTGTKTVYGYYVTTNGDTELLWIEEFSGAPFVLPSGGGTISITAKVTLE